MLSCNALYNIFQYFIYLVNKSSKIHPVYLFIHAFFLLSFCLAYWVTDNIKVEKKGMVETENNKLELDYIQMNKAMHGFRV